jgi:hypothetical protein
VAPLGKLVKGSIAGSANRKVNRIMDETTQPDPQYVVVKWADAHQGPGHWCTLDEDDKDEHIVATCGLLIPEDDGGKPKHLTIAQSQSPDGFVDHVIYIPQGMVRSMQFLKPFTGELQP